MSGSAFRDDLASSAEAVGRALDALLPPSGERIADAMRHAALGGGKRLRGFLVLKAAALFGGEPARAARVAAAVECLHAYSLVHDDLPCMDDDDLRRGLPTVHVKWDEATAVLAGDALQTAAFAILADPATHPDGAVRAALCLGLAGAAGQAGMVGGQAQDIAAESRPFTLEETRAMQGLKTGALIRFAARAGGLVAGAAPADIARLDRFAAALGLAFQLRDDILDAAGDPARAGKRLGKDARAGKATFLRHLGLAGTEAEAHRLAAEATAALDGYGTRAAPLRDLARHAVTRDR